MSSLRPCTSCGHDELMVMPNVSIDIASATTVMGLAAYAGQWVVTVVVCTRCTHSSFYTVNGPAMLERVPGAAIVKAQRG